ncbi:MAG: hypothetical protein U9Q81_07240 [Pseudomonadota bacterium]|nr:hypothetical protein [Pseudomonadota bacterium]
MRDIGGLLCNFSGVWIIACVIEKDRSAAYFQRRHVFYLYFVYVGSATIVALVSAHAIFFQDYAWLIGAEILLLLAMLWLSFRDKGSSGAHRSLLESVFPGSKSRAGHQAQWLRNRFLAEKLRCALFRRPARPALPTVLRRV